MSRKTSGAALKINSWQIFALIMGTFLAIYFSYFYLLPYGEQHIWGAAQRGPEGAAVQTTTTVGPGATVVGWTIRTYESYNESADIDGFGAMQWYRPGVGGPGQAGPVVADDGETVLTIAPEDGGRGYIVFDYQGTTVATVNVEKSLRDPYLGSSGIADVDNDGTDERFFSVDFSGLGGLVAGEVKKTIASQIYFDLHQTNAITLVSSSNATGILTTKYEDKYASGYFTSWTGNGYKLKLVYFKITLPNAGNITYADPANSYFILEEVKVGDFTWSSGAFDSARGQWVIDIGIAQTHEPEIYVGFYKDRLKASTWPGWELHARCRYPDAEQLIELTLSFTFVAPDGTTWSETVAAGFSS